MTDREQLDDLIRDVEAMKSSIRKNQGIIRDVLLDSDMGFLSLILGLATLAFSLAGHFLSASYGGFGSIPFPARAGLIAFISLASAAGAILKFAIMGRHSRMMKPSIGLRQFMRIFYSKSMGHTTAACLILMGCASALAIALGRPWLALPLLICLMVVPLNAVAEVTGIEEYYLSGYASLAGGIASFFLIGPAPFLALALTSSCVYFSFAAATAAAMKRRNGK